MLRVPPHIPPQPPPTDPSFWRPGEPGWGNRERGYQAATVCRRGHPQQTTLTVPPDPESLGFCPDCGAEILARCLNCGIRIRGELHIPGQVWLEENFAPRKFCDSCGEPYPWATRQDRIYQLENILDQQDIDDTDKLLVREELERLRVEGPTLEPDAQAAIWRRIKQRAPGLVTGAAWQIGQSLLTAYVQQKAGLG
jgi:hypothetical protein